MRKPVYCDPARDTVCSPDELNNGSDERRLGDAANQDATWLQDAVNLAQGDFWIGQMFYDMGSKNNVEAVVIVR